VISCRLARRVRRCISSRCAAFSSQLTPVLELDSGKHVWHYRPEEIAPSSAAPARAQGTGFG
jgi:hypothetical protein